MSPPPRLRTLAPSRLLWPLTPLYAAALGVKNAAYANRWLPSHRLRSPVISVGNLSVGGAGKTPLVIRLAELLAARGFAVDVLSRGYGRVSAAAARVDLDVPRHAASLYGDEPLLIAQATGVPVYVAASRYAAGLLAEQGHALFTYGSPPHIHLLDDGFQHRQLARAVDIVVLHRGDFSEPLLPAGRMREPLSALRRASVAVLRAEDAALVEELRRRGLMLPVWLMERAIELPQEVGSPSTVAFCGIAHPQEFFALLTRSGVALSATHGFSDHHVYSPGDIFTLAASVKAAGATRLLTTEKDLVRLGLEQRVALSRAAALHAVPLRTRLLDEPAAIAQLLALAGLPSAWPQTTPGRPEPAG